MRCLDICFAGRAAHCQSPHGCNAAVHIPAGNGRLQHVDRQRCYASRLRRTAWAPGRRQRVRKFVDGVQARQATSGPRLPGWLRLRAVLDRYAAAELSRAVGKVAECVLRNLAQALDVALNSLAGYVDRVGSYSVFGNSATCTSCGAGTAAGSVGSALSSACVTCAAGTYAGSGTQLGCCAAPVTDCHATDTEDQSGLNCRGDWPSLSRVQAIRRACPAIPALTRHPQGSHPATLGESVQHAAQLHSLQCLGESAACGQQQPAHNPLCCCSSPPSLTSAVPLCLQSHLLLCAAAGRQPVRQVRCRRGKQVHCWQLQQRHFHAR